MALLFDEDYEVLQETGLVYTEDESQRFLIFYGYPLRNGLYVSEGEPVESADVLVVIPANYNTSGIDMFWTHPRLGRADGKAIPAIAVGSNEDPRFHNGKEYFRWSRHWQGSAWKPKEDTVLKILSRIEWALTNPDADQV